MRFCGLRGQAAAIVVALALAACCMAPHAAWAQGGEQSNLVAGSVVQLVVQAYEDHEVDGWIWKADEDGEAATLVAYRGSSLTPAAPATVQSANKALPVAAVVMKPATGAPAVTSVDLSAAAATLQRVQVYGCALAKLDASALKQLVYLDVTENALTELKLPASLVELRCAGNKLMDLDLAACPALERLDCSRNMIYELDLTACPALYFLDCSNNRLVDLECGANLKLGDVFCHHNYIVSRLKALADRYGSDEGVVLPQNAGKPAARPSTSTGTGSGSDVSAGSGSTASASVKAANTMTVKAKALKAKKGKKTTFKAAKAFTVSKAQGALTYKVAAYDKKAKKKITVSKAGKVTVKKGLKKGTYKVKVKVTAAGDATHKAKTVTVTLKVKVK